MTFTDGDAYCEDMDPENLAVVNTAKEPSAVGKWENRNDNIFEEEFNNVEDLCEDMEPGNLVTNEEAKDPTFIDKDMDESDGDMKEVNNMYLFPPFRIAEGPFHFELRNSDTFLYKYCELCEYMEQWYKFGSPYPLFGPDEFDFRMRIHQEEIIMIKQGEIIRMKEEVIKMKLQCDRKLLMQEEIIMIKQGEIIRMKQEEIILMKEEVMKMKQEEIIKIKEEVIKMKLQCDRKLLMQGKIIRMKEEMIKMKSQRYWKPLMQEEIIKRKEEVIKMKLQCDRKLLMQEEIIKRKQEEIILMKEEVIKMKQEENIEINEEVMKMKSQRYWKLLMQKEIIEIKQEEIIMMKEEVIRMKEIVLAMTNWFKMTLTLLAYKVILCSILSKSAFQKQLRLKYAFGKAVLLVLWTSGDVEKHPGPSLDDMKTIRALFTRLVKEVQGKKVVDWATAPPGWDENVVSFQDMNNMKGSDNEEKYALLYEALCVFMKMFGSDPDWFVEEMTYVETGNAPELKKCQTVRKVRELLDQHSPADRDDIIRRVRYPHQGGSVPAQAVKTTNRNQQSRQRKCPFNVPGYRPISAIKESDTARKIAEGCIAQSKNAGKYQSGNHQTMTKKRSATTTTVQPASKQPRTSAANTSTQPATSTIVRPNSASPAISIAICAQPVVNATASSKRLPATSTIVRPTTSTNSAVATACYTGSHSSTFCTSRASNNISTGTLPSTAQVSKHLNHDGQQSNDTSTGTHPNAAKNRQQPNRGGQPSNLISLPSDDLGDLGFSSNVDLDQFIKQIMKDGKM